MLLLLLLVARKDVGGSCQGSCHIDRVESTAMLLHDALKLSDA
jgi:hypothetical protein